MKSFIFILLLHSLVSTAQQNLPRIENDTLYTSCGYTIYKGQTLQLANGSSEAGYFRYLKFHYSMGRNDTYILQNSSILVDKLRNYKNSGAGNYSIRISGTATRKDNSKMEVDIILEFENALTGLNGSASELTVPEAFRKKQTEIIAVEPKKQTAPVETKNQPVPDEMKKLLIADEIKKLFDLYKAGALTKEEYEARKKKLLEQ